MITGAVWEQSGQGLTDEVVNNARGSVRENSEKVYGQSFWVELL